MDLKTVKQIMESSLSKLIENDNKLIDQGVKEECINHRLAIYIDEYYRQFCGEKNYCIVDLEYNKNLDEKDREKEIHDKHGRVLSHGRLACVRCVDRRVESLRRV